MPAPPSREDSVPEVEQFGFIPFDIEIEHLGLKSEVRDTQVGPSKPIALLTSRVNPH